MDDPLQMHPIRRRNLPNFAGPVAAVSGKLSRPSAEWPGTVLQCPWQRRGLMSFAMGFNGISLSFCEGYDGIL